jgi:hypothetical protein
MPRWVEPPATQPAGPSREGWGTRIVKYVPTELVAAFTMLMTSISMIPGADLTRKIIALVIILVFFGCTYAYVALKIPAGQPKTAHFVIMPFALLAWAYPISSSMLGGWFNGFIATGLQGLVVLLSIFFPITEGTGETPAFQ